jgi:hypothetical protein
MKKFVFTVKDDVCAANGKDVNATELLSVMAHYGSVEDCDKVVSAIKAEYQASIDALTAQLNAIKEQELTEDEIKIVKAYRDAKNSVVCEHAAIAESYKKQLEAVKQESEQRTARIRAILGE